MIIYISIFSFFSFLCIIEDKLSNINIQKLKYLSFLILLTFVGFRFEIGADWSRYLLYFNKDEELRNILFEYDIGYTILNFIIKKMNLDFVFLNFILSLIFLSCFFFFFNKSKNFFLIITISLPIIIFLYGMGFNRQIVSFGFFLLTTKFFLQKKIIFFLISFIFAFIFHKSVILLFPIFIISYLVNKTLTLIAINKYINLKNLILIFLLFILFLLFCYYIFLAFQGSFNERIIYYFDAYFKMYSNGFYFRIFPILISIILFTIYFKKIKIRQNELIFYTICIYLLLSFLVISFILGPVTIFDRLLVFLCFTQIIFHEKVYENIDNMSIKLGYKFSLILFYFIIFFLWFTFAEHRNSWLPYKNIIYL